MRKNAIVTIMLVFICPSKCRSSDNDELLEVVRAAHRSARQAVQHFSCKYLVQQTLPAKQILASGKYARSNNLVSIKDGNEGISTMDSLLRSGQCKAVARSWKDGKIDYFATLHAEAHFFSWGDVWQRMAIDHSDQESQRCNYDMVLDRIGKKAQVSRDRIADRDCVRIEVEENNKFKFTMMLKIWHDIGYNYLIRKQEEYEISHPTNRKILTITEFLEAEPGVIVPLKCRMDTIRDDKVIKSYVVELSDVRVNQPIPDSIFVLPAIPAGTKLQDFIRGTIGPIGADWKPVGPAISQTRAMLTPASNDNVEGAPTNAEPREVNQLLLYGSVFVFAICAVILLIRRQKASRDSVEPPS